MAAWRAKAQLRLQPSGFLLDAANGESYTLNPTGQVIVGALLDGRTTEDVWRDVVEAFEVEEEKARRDVERFVVRLRQFGLIRQVADEDRSNMESSSESNMDYGPEEGRDE